MINANAEFDRARIELIFQDEGLPSLVRGWHLSTRVLPRMMPFLLLVAVGSWLLAYLLLHGTSAAWFLAGELTYISGTLAVAVVTHRSVQVGMVVGCVVAFSWPAAVAFVKVAADPVNGGFGPNAQAALKLTALLAAALAAVFVVAYTVTALGVLRLVHLAVTDLAQTGLSRTVMAAPLLILLTVFLLLNPDVWQVAHGVGLGRLAGAFAVFAAIAAWTGVARTRELLDRRADETGRPLIPWPRYTADGVPVTDEHRRIPRLTDQQIINIAVALTGRLLAQAALISFVLAVVLLLLGTALVTRTTGEAWIDQPGGDHYLHLLGVAVSATLLKVTLLLTGFNALYFVVVAAVDGQYRKAVYDPSTYRLLRLLQLHAAYCAHVGQPVSRVEQDLLPALKEVLRKSFRSQDPLKAPRASLWPLSLGIGVIIELPVGLAARVVADLIIGRRRQQTRRSGGPGGRDWSTTVAEVLVDRIRVFVDSLRPQEDSRLPQRWDPDTDPLFQQAPSGPTSIPEAQTDPKPVNRREPCAPGRSSSWEEPDDPGNGQRQRS
ncbi:hypothetical protein [Actinoplanes sp. NPDC020271]|uniref:hypothetical protein n=1 Tax=Actinoplanes sp. NPDC020271 TaxID=3363896 RepID=UPI0037B83731